MGLSAQCRAVPDTVTGPRRSRQHVGNAWRFPAPPRRYRCAPRVRTLSLIALAERLRLTPCPPSSSGAVVGVLEAVPPRSHIDPRQIGAATSILHSWVHASQCPWAGGEPYPIYTRSGWETAARRSAPGGLGCASAGQRVPPGRACVRLDLPTLGARETRRSRCRHFGKRFERARGGGESQGCANKRRPASARRREFRCSVPPIRLAQCFLVTMRVAFMPVSGTRSQFRFLCSI